jgi:hypothetical protein
MGCPQPPVGSLRCPANFCNGEKFEEFLKLGVDELKSRPIVK